MDKDNIIKITASVTVDSYNQTALADCTAYEQYVQISLLNEFSLIIKNANYLPMQKREIFNEKTYENIHQADLYIVSEEVMREYAKLKSLVSYRV